MSTSRVVCLNCMDGRTQIPVIEWVKAKTKADYVDMITEPGIDGLFLKSEDVQASLTAKVQLSIDKNQSHTIIVVGHHDCQGHPVSDEEHKVCIRQAAGILEEKFPNMPVIQLWINSDFQGEQI